MADRIKQLSAYYTPQEIQIPINEMWSHGLFLDTLGLGCGFYRARISIQHIDYK